MKKLYIITAIWTIGAFLFYGCNKDEEPEPIPEVYCYSTVKSTITDNQLIYRFEMHISSTAPINAAFETGPEGTFELSDKVAFQNARYEISKLTEYSEKEPSEGKYLFNIQFADGREKTVSRSVSKPFLIPAKNISINMDEYGFIEVKWDTIENADFYRVTSYRNETRKVISGIINTCETMIDASEFSTGESFDIIIEIAATDLKDNPEMVSSESSAQIIFHVNEFKPWWTDW